MARTVQTKFLGLNTDLPAVKLESGTARESLNVTVATGELAKRGGFAEWEDDVKGDSTGIVGMWVAHFKAGTYIVVKLSSGAHYQRKTSEAAFTLITATHTHKGTEPGFAFMWADRFICGDSGGVSQWNPAVASGVMLKAGLPQPTPINIAAAVNGAKDGYYHCHFSYYNNALDVEGVVSGPCKATGGAAETRIADSNGGVAFTAVVPDATGYEATHSRVYTTMGNTEVKESNGILREDFSYKAAIDVQLTLGRAPGMNKGDSVLDWTNTFTNEGGIVPGCSAGCWSGGVAVYAAASGTKAELSLNSGGVLLTAAAVGVGANDISVIVLLRDPADASATPTIATSTNDLSGLQVTITVNDAAGTGNDTTNQDVVTALAGNGTCAAAFTATTSAGASFFVTAAEETYLRDGKESSQDWIYYSKFGRPTMVPQLVTYSVTAAGSDNKSWTDSRTVWPKGDHHVLPSPCDGAVVECVAAGGTIVLYTATSTWVMRSTPQGKLYAVKRKEGIGCVGHPAAAAFEFEAHALGERAWTVTTATGFSEISRNTWSTTLEDIPVAQQTDAVMAAFPSKDQVWCAVTKSGATTPQRILVLDMSLGTRELTVFELADDAWETSEYITAMCELAYAGAEQTMLVATNHGRIFKYPSGADDDGNDFQATWRGVFGAERSAYTQRMEVAEIHAGDNCAGRVRWSVRPKRESGDSPPHANGYIATDNAINPCNGVADKVDARFWEIEISSPPVGSEETATTWTVHDILLRIGRTDTQ